MTKAYRMFTEEGYNKEPYNELRKKGFTPFSFNWYSGIGYHNQKTGEYTLLREFGHNETMKVSYNFKV